MPASPRFSQIVLRFSRSGEKASQRIASLALAVATLVVPQAQADPVSISLVGTNGGIASAGSTVTLQSVLPDGRQIFDIVIDENWQSLAPGVLSFANFPEGSILDITKMVANNTGSTWTSFQNLTETDDANVPPFGFTFEAIETTFFEYEASWQMSANQFARCQQLFPSCGDSFRGNLFTQLNGTISPGETGRIRFLLQVDRGDFTLTQTPGDAPVPEPSTLVLFGTAALAAWRGKKRRRAEQT